MRSLSSSAIALPLLMAAVWLLPADSLAQVYKCKGASGETVYTQDPCTADAKPVSIRGSQPGQMTHRLDRQCLSDASARIYAASNDRIAGLHAHIQTLATQANNTPRIAELRRAIGREHANAQRQIDAARQGCRVEVPNTPAPRSDLVPIESVPGSSPQ